MQLDFSDFGIWLSHWSFSFLPFRNDFHLVMPQDPPSQPDESGIPLKPRPTLANLGKINTELNLWALDNENPELAPPVVESDEPSDRLLEVEDLPNVTVIPESKPLEKVDRLQIKPVWTKPSSSGRPILKAVPTMGIEFDDLGNWEEDEISPPKDEILTPKDEISPPKDEISTPEDEVRDQPEHPPASESVPEPAAQELPAGAIPAADVPAPDALPSLEQPVSLSKLEKIGLITLFAVLLLGGGGFLFSSIYDLPSEPERVMARDFPIKGERLEIKAATTYWRPPIATGDNRDTFRRGTVFIPAIKLTIGSGSGALRFVFRNQDGDPIGDVQTRTVSAGETIEIPATAGFDDAGMHAAYRTGQDKPWTITVKEAASVNAANEAFMKFFEINISTDLR